ncbi:MAG: VIT1/CCC1 transporter family protein [Microthrixaceae bacterium]
MSDTTKPGAAPAPEPHSHSHGGGGRSGPNWQVHSHRDVSGGAARAAVFGVSDGLVSNTALILGVAGANPPANTVLVAGLAGLIAGAVSMAAGEYVSMQAQKELIQRELAIEADAIEAHPERERRELVGLYRSRGVDRTTAERVATQLMADPDLALEVHAREELGMGTESIGSPWQAAGSSFLAFTLGAVVPLVPWIVGSGTGAIFASVVVAVVLSAVVGGLLARFTERSVVLSGLRQVLITSASCAVTYGIGSVVGANV